MRPSLAAKTRLTLRVHIVCCKKGAIARRYRSTTLSKACRDSPLIASDYAELPAWCLCQEWSGAFAGIVGLWLPQVEV